MRAWLWPRAWRIHGTTGRVPIEHFAEEETSRLQPLPAYGRFEQVRELTRRVTTDCSVVVDTNAYSVPWLLIGERVRVLVSATRVRIQHGAGEVAEHSRSSGRRQRITDPAHFVGVAGAEGRMVRKLGDEEPARSDSESLRLWRLILIDAPQPAPDRNDPSRTRPAPKQHSRFVRVGVSQVRKSGCLLTPRGSGSWCSEMIRVWDWLSVSRSAALSRSGCRLKPAFQAVTPSWRPGGGRSLWFRIRFSI